MKITSFMMVLLLLLGITLKAQSTRINLGLGGMYHNFQDTRFSDLQITGIGPSLELGFRYVTEYSYIVALAGVNMHLTAQPNVAEDKNGISSLGLNARVGYLHRITPGLYLGATWDLFDYTVRNTEELGNNSNFFHTASDLFFSAKYLYVVNDNWSYEFGGNLGIISFSKYAPSFTANLLQKAIDEGRASFQDENVRSPFALNNIETKPIWQQLYPRTHAEVFYRRRFSLAYQWSMRSFADQKGYPLTMANHTLSIRFHFISNPK